MVFNRKRKDNRSASFILDDSPKRTKVQAQRKFAQTSNINSPVLTPVTEIEIQEKVMPEPIELLPMKRPNTEDFLTFLCFRGTPALPQGLSFFNNATMTDGPPPISESPGSSKNGVILPANLGKAPGDKPFIAFGVRKRADPVVVSRHMDKKRRHALALQALRRKYQEQKMAKIRAITISKLSEKVHTNKTVVRTTRSITKAEPVTKKNVAQKTKITVVATKHVKVTTRQTSIQQTPSTTNIKQKMTLRNLRNRVVKREIKISNTKAKKAKEKEKAKNSKLKAKEVKEEVDEEDAEEEEEEEEEAEGEDDVDEEETQEEEEEEEFSSEEEASEESQEEMTPKKNLPPKRDLRVTRSNIVQNKRRLLRQQNLKGSPTSPRLRSQLRRKILQGKPELKAKRRILTRKVQVKTKTKTIAKKIEAKPKEKDKPDKVDKNEKKPEEKCDVKTEKETCKEKTRANTRENVKKKQELQSALKKDPKGKKVVAKGKNVTGKDDAKVKIEEDKETKGKNAKKKVPDEKNKKSGDVKVKKEKEDEEKVENVKIEKVSDEKCKKVVEEPPEKKIAKKVEKKSKEPAKKNVSDEEKTKSVEKSKKIAAKEAKKSLEDKAKDVRSVKSPSPDKKADNEDPPVKVTKKGEKTEAIINRDKQEKIQKKVDDKVGKVGEKETVAKTSVKTEKAKSIVLPIVENNRFIIDKDVVIEEIEPFKPLPEQKPAPKVDRERRSESPLKKTDKNDVSDAAKLKKVDKSVDKVDKTDKQDKDKPPSPKSTKKLDKKDKNDKSTGSAVMEKSEKNSKENAKKTGESSDKGRSETVPVRERPARKTKLAAAIYMEILGRKLVNDDDVDDMSIDSFPELPNVRRMEQRENELKARMKCGSKKSAPVSPPKVDKSGDKPDKKRKDIATEADLLQAKSKEKESVEKPAEKRKCRLSSSLQESESSKSATMKNTTANSKGKNVISDSDSEKLIMKKNKKQKIDANEDEVPVKKALTKKSKKLDDTFSFSESDEEPLVKLTQKASENEKTKSETESTVKQKRECAKRPQNYLPLFSSSDEEEKFFRQSERPPSKKKVAKTEPVAAQEVVLSSKDIGKRFGKGKVNMSNEQIEKWLNDSALAGGMVIKAENDEMLKFGERIPTETSLDNNLSTVNMEHLKNSLLKEEKSKTDVVLVSSVHTTPEKSNTSSQKPLSNEKKTIFRKAEQISKNANAFSACNESSVYAFEADNEDSVSTPFRRPSRRPSSTATSRSEDDTINRLSLGLGLGMDIEQKRFRLPTSTTMTPTTNASASVAKTKEVSLLLTDESNTSGPITVNVDTAENEPSNQGDNQHMFYQPHQPGVKASASGMGLGLLSIQKGAASKLARHGSSGSIGDKSQMFPPSSPNTFKKTEKSKATACCSMSETSDSNDFKYKIPSSPSASSSSSAKLVNKRAKQVNEDLYKPVNDTDFPGLLGEAKIVEAPVFHPTEKEFVDPLEYIEKIREKAEKFGICRIVPPGNFKPECKVLDEMRFTAYNQYVHKMMHRWGPNFRELVAIRKYLATQSISLKHPPWIGGIEVDLPKLYQTVQILGGLKEVIEKKKWPRVSELMKIPKSAQDRVTKLDDMYCKYLLPYDTLSPDEREKLFAEVEADWAKREAKMLEKAKNGTNVPEEAEEEEDEDEEDESESEADIECIVKGRSMALSAFYRIARNTMAMWFREGEPTAQEVEEEFWKHVTERQHHICVHSGSIDSGNLGYGFAVSKNSPFARHAWNLKVLTNNSGSILRSMGPVMGLTVPTLHVGMLYAGCCWYRDPHSLPWIEYLHTGANKIWYGIPDSMSDKFHETMIKLVPHYCLNKSLWLPTDTVMVPPSTLVGHGVSLTKTLQEPGQFVVVFPKAFTSNICAGYVVSESVFWAPPDWLSCADKVFLELRNSCEPSMFSYERLLLSVAQDPRTDVKVLQRIIPPIERMIEREQRERAKIKELGVKKTERLPLLDAKRKKKMQDTDTEYICEECRWNLYCSMICDSPDNGFYCLEHAIENINEKRLEIENLKLMYTYDDGELENFVAKIHEAIETKLIKKVGGKFAGMATLLNR